MTRSDPRVGLPTARITSATTTTIQGSRALHRVVVETALAGTATFNDGTGTKMILPVGYVSGVHELNMAFASKLEVITSAADRLVLVYE
jgi:hypothetical protein